MKKKYLKPSLELTECLQDSQIMAGSGVYSDNGIDYGGEDINGILDPESRFNGFDNSQNSY